MTETQALNPALLHACCGQAPEGLSQTQMQQDQTLMQQCLAMVIGQEQAPVDIPIAALLWDTEEQRVLAKACNRTIVDCDATAHAEVNVIREACQAMNNYRLNKTVLYVTLEPCQMCMGAILAARIARVVFAAPDQKVGWLSKQFYQQTHTLGNHHFRWTGGVLADEASTHLKRFFRDFCR